MTAKVEQGLIVFWRRILRGFTVFLRCEYARVLLIGDYHNWNRLHCSFVRFHQYSCRKFDTITGRKNIHRKIYYPAKWFICKLIESNVAD